MELRNFVEILGNLFFRTKYSFGKLPMKEKVELVYTELHKVGLFCYRTNNLL